VKVLPHEASAADLYLQVRDRAGNESELVLVPVRLP
jgi:hypothetical protein